MKSNYGVVTYNRAVMAIVNNNNKHLEMTI